MSIQRTYYCDGPAIDRDEPCHTNATTASSPPYLPHGIIEVREQGDNGDDTHHFCGWDCLMKYAAAQPIPEIIPLDGGDE